MASIKLGVAQLCPDCDLIYEDVACPTCLSQNGLWLSRVLSKAKMAHGCWEWTGTRKHGYGRMAGFVGAGPGRREMIAHRLVYRILIGPIPKGTEMDHLCRNKGCVNPWHLEPVTHTTNIRRGAATRLSPKEVEEIRAAKTSIVQITRQYGISDSQARRIKNGQSWRNDDNS